MKPTGMSAHLSIALWLIYGGALGPRPVESTGATVQTLTITNGAAFAGPMVVSNPPLDSSSSTLVEDGNSKGQTFALPTAAHLSGLILQLDDHRPPDDPDGTLRVELYALNGGYPEGQPLFAGEGALPSGLATGDLMGVTFPTNVQLDAGAYAWTLSTTNAGLSFNLSADNGFTAGNLIRKNSASGNAWDAGTSADLDFVFAVQGDLGSRPPPSAGPNIIVVLADDLGWTDISAGGPNKEHASGYYETPNIERLARAGLSLSSCYVQPNCAPSRAALLSGQYAPRNGNGVYAVDNLNRGNGAPELVAPSQNEDVPAGAITVAEALRAAGYVTAHLGKYHVGGHEGGAATLPTNQGFDDNYGGGNAGNPGSYWPDDGTGKWQYGANVGPELDAYAAPYTQDYIDNVLRPYDHGSGVDQLKDTKKFLTDAMGDAVLDFLDTHRRGPLAAYPVYVQFHTYAVHTPTQSRPDLKAYYEGKPAAGSHNNPTYAGLVEGADQALGRILDYLNDPNGDGNASDSMATNTLLLFCSDNGGFVGPTDNAPLRGRKGMFYDGGIRVPLICRWTGHIPTNTTSDTLIHAVDIYPTLLDIAGAPRPSPDQHRLDGVSFAAHLLHPDIPRTRPPIVYHFPGYLDNRARPCSLTIGDVGGKRYKLMYTYDTAYTIMDNSGSAVDSHGPWELYCLTDDIGETNDMLDGDYWKWLAHAAVVSNLTTTIREWHVRADDTTWVPSYPTVRSTGERLAAPPSRVPPPWHPVTSSSVSASSNVAPPASLK